MSNIDSVLGKNEVISRTETWGEIKDLPPGDPRKEAFLAAGEVGKGKLKIEEGVVHLGRTQYDNAWENARVERPEYRDFAWSVFTRDLQDSGYVEVTYGVGPISDETTQTQLTLAAREIASFLPQTSEHIDLMSPITVGTRWSEVKDLPEDDERKVAFKTLGIVSESEGDLDSGDMVPNNMNEVFAASERLRRMEADEGVAGVADNFKTEKSTSIAPNGEEKLWHYSSKISIVPIKDFVTAEVLAQRVGRLKGLLPPSQA